MRPRRLFARRRLLQGGLGAAVPLGAGAPAARADGVDVITLALQRGDGALLLDFAARVALPRAVEDALQRGVPVYFAAQATLWRYRWYWRDERIARVTRTWRLAYQPLTATWRVGLGGLNQHHPTLADALGTMTRISQWRLAELSQIDPDSRHSVEFSWRLDSSQLPSPMILGLLGGSDFALGVERTLRLE